MSKTINVDLKSVSLVVAAIVIITLLVILFARKPNKKTDDYYEALLAQKDSTIKILEGNAVEYRDSRDFFEKRADSLAKNVKPKIYYIESKKKRDKVVTDVDAIDDTDSLTSAIINFYNSN